MTEDGRAKVLDLGTTKIIGGALPRERPSTEVGSVIGTFTFMSPEQLLGERVGFKSDIYALGVLAYLVLTGHHPFEGDDGIINAQALTYRSVVGEPHPITRFRPSCPAEVAAFIEELLAKDPDRRPPSMAQVAARARQLRTAGMVAVGLDPDSGLEHLVRPDNRTAARTLERDEPKTDEVDEPGPEQRTPAGTVRMAPVPEEVDAYLEGHRSPARKPTLREQQAAAGGGALSVAGETEPMAAVDIGIANRGTPAAKPRREAMGGTSNAGVAIASGTGLRLGSMPRWLPLAAALITASLVVIMAWWVPGRTPARDSSPDNSLEPARPATDMPTAPTAAPDLHAKPATPASAVPDPPAASDDQTTPPVPQPSAQPTAGTEGLPPPAATPPSPGPPAVASTSKGAPPAPPVYPESLE